MKESIVGLSKHTVVYGIGSILVAGLNIIAIPIYTRLFAPPDYGTIELIVTANAFLSLLLGLGINSAVHRSYFEEKTDSTRKEVVSTGGIFLLAWSLIILLPAFLFSDQTSLLLFGNIKNSALIQVGAILLILTTFLGYSNDTLRLHFAPWKFTKVHVLVVLTTFLSTLFYVLQLKLGVLGYFAGGITGTTLALLVSLYYIRKDLAPIFSKKKLRELLEYGVPLVPASVLYIMIGLSDRFILKEFVGLDQVGIYAVAYKVVGLLILCSSAFAQSWNPFFVKTLAENKNHRAIFAQVFDYLLLVMCTLAVALSLFSSDIVRLLTSSKYHSGAPIIGVMTIGVIALASVSVLSTGIAVKRKTSYFIPITALAAVSNLVINFLLIPSFGIMGAAAAMAISYTVLALGSYVVSQKLYPLPYNLGRMTLLIVLTLLFVGISYVVSVSDIIISIGIKSTLLATFVATLFVAKLLGKKEIALGVQYAKGWGSKAFGALRGLSNRINR